MLSPVRLPWLRKLCPQRGLGTQYTGAKALRLSRRERREPATGHIRSLFAHMMGPERRRFLL